MTPDEARKLLGGYATGTLTPQEHQALLEAALHDQWLFNELMNEQPLKEVLDDPAMRAEVLHSLDERPRRRVWPWAFVMTGALAVAAVAFVVMTNPEERTIRHMEIAKDVGPPKIESAPPVPDRAAPSAPKPAPAPSRAKVRTSNAEPLQEAVPDAVTAEPVNEPPPALAAPPVRAEAPYINSLRARTASDSVGMLAGAHPFQLRYSVQKATSFAPGAIPEVTLETNASSSLYAFYRMRTGDWIPLTPGGLNLAAGVPSKLPAPPARVEVLLIVSRQPIPDLTAAGAELTAAVERARIAPHREQVIAMPSSDSTTLVDPNAGPDARIVTTIPLQRLQ
jgi:hypothetical protein